MKRKNSIKKVVAVAFAAVSLVLPFTSACAMKRGMPSTPPSTPPSVPLPTPPSTPPNKGIPTICPKLHRKKPTKKMVQFKISATKNPARILVFVVNENVESENSTQ